MARSGMCTRCQASGAYGSSGLCKSCRDKAKQVSPRLKGGKKPRRPTLTADRNAALKLHSLIIRARGVCEWPGCDKVCSCSTAPVTHRARPDCPLECSHVLTRDRGATATDLRNAFALCSFHHRYVHDFPFEHARFAAKRLGDDVLDELRDLAHAGIQGNASVFWREERARLKAVFDEICKAAA